MRPPVLLLLGIGSGVFLPLPLFLLWPFVGIAWLLLLLGLLVAPTGGPVRQRLSTGKQALVAFASLPGLRVDVEPKDGVGVNIWII
jgi:hypothetical protein